MTNDGSTRAGAIKLAFQNWLEGREPHRLVPHDQGNIARKSKGKTMSDEKLSELVESFKEDLVALIREQTLESIQEALGGGAPAPRRGPAPKARAAASNGASRGKGQKRPPEELAALVENFYAEIQGNPGLRVEELANKMGIPTKELALPAKKLLAENRIYTEGQKRATRYYAGSKRGGAARPRAAARRTPKKKAKAKTSGKKKGRRPRGSAALNDALEALDRLGSAEPAGETSETEELVQVRGSGEPLKRDPIENVTGEQPVITQTDDGRFQVTIDGKVYFAKRERDLRKRLPR